MALLEIRETLEQHEVVIATDDITIIQKRISLKPGQRMTMMSVDFMDDSQIIPTGSGVQSFAFEFFLSPYPIIYTDMKLAEIFSKRGPLGADDAVLFKHISVHLAGGVNTKVEMPNNFLGSLPTYSWYTPQLYLTAFIHNGDGSPFTIDDLGFSVYCSIKTKNVDSVEYGMGIIAEYDEAQGRNMMAQGHVIATNMNVQQAFPMWRAGGIRPEHVLGADRFAEFWIPGFAQDAEKTMDTSQITIFYQKSRTCVAWDEAFGAIDVSKGPIPDWIRFIQLGGIEFGLERDQFPPTKYFDNGNTMML